MFGVGEVDSACVCPRCDDILGFIERRRDNRLAKVSETRDDIPS